MPEFIGVCREMYKNHEFIQRDYYLNPLNKHFDIVLSSGTLNSNIKNANGKGINPNKLNMKNCDGNSLAIGKKLILCKYHNINKAVIVIILLLVITILLVRRRI